MIEARLLRPEDAARYLGLGSRWAVYRLIAAGQLPAVKLAGKLRVDREDLNAYVTTLKSSTAQPPPTARRSALAAVPAKLAPLSATRREDEPRIGVTRVLTVPRRSEPPNRTEEAT